MYSQQKPPSRKNTAVGGLEQPPRGEGGLVEVAAVGRALTGVFLPHQGVAKK